MLIASSTHSTTIGYILWIFGFTGAHRFYFGRPWTGTLWFLTAGLLGVGWLVDLFLIPSMARDAERRFAAGPWDYSIAWLLLTFGGVLGLHRFYLRRWVSAVLYLCTGGLLLVGVVYDFWMLNARIDARNRAAAARTTIPPAPNPGTLA